MPTVSELVARKEYDRAAEQLREEIERTGSLPRRQELADVLALAGRTTEAADLLASVADDLARAGQPAKAIALLKFPSSSSTIVVRCDFAPIMQIITTGLERFIWR